MKSKDITTIAKIESVIHEDMHLNYGQKRWRLLPPSKEN